MEFLKKMFYFYVQILQIGQTFWNEGGSIYSLPATFVVIKLSLLILNNFFFYKFLTQAQD